MKSGFDRLYTPRWLADAMARAAYPRPDSLWLDPACGEGVLLEALRAFEPRVQVHGSDICRGPGQDFLSADYVVGSPVEGVLMNPPNSEPRRGIDLEFMVKALAFAPRVVALLRVGCLHNRRWHTSMWSRYRLRTVGHVVGRVMFEGPDAVQVRGKHAGKRAHSEKDFVVVEVDHGDPHIPSQGYRIYQPKRLQGEKHDEERRECSENDAGTGSARTGADCVLHADG
jgi:hypothetical protein